MIKEIKNLLEMSSYDTTDEYNEDVSVIDVTTEEEREELAKDILKIVSPHIKEDGKLFDGLELWNKATELSFLETNGYWKALRDLESLGVIRISGIFMD